MLSLAPPLRCSYFCTRTCLLFDDRTCANQQSAVNISANAVAKPTVYLAQFNTGISYANSSVPFCAGRASHQYAISPSTRKRRADLLFHRRDDIYTVFGASLSTITRSQVIVMYEVMDRWGAFARTGSPNTPSLPVWPPVESGSNLNLLIFGGTKARSTLASSQRAEQCAVGQGVWGRTVPFDQQLLL